MSFLLAHKARLLLAGSALFAFTAAHAQNYVDNSHFDETISPWRVFPDGAGYWTYVQDHHGAGSGEVGSLFLGGPTSGSTATQCISIISGLTYVASAWTYSGCIGSRLYIYWTGDSCATGADSAFVRSTKANEWENLIVTADAPPGATRVSMQLVNPGGCLSGIYFDDASFTRDDIFWDPFDPVGVSLR